MVGVGVVVVGVVVGGGGVVVWCCCWWWCCCVCVVAVVVGGGNGGGGGGGCGGGGGGGPIHFHPLAHEELVMVPPYPPFGHCRIGSDSSVSNIWPMKNQSWGPCFHPLAIAEWPKGGHRGAATDSLRFVEPRFWFNYMCCTEASI